MKTLVESIFDSEQTYIDNSRATIGGYAIGDIIVNDYSWSARIVKFYEVVSMKGKATLVVKRLKHKFVSGNMMHGSIVPEEGKYVDNKTMDVRVGKRGPVIGDKYCSNYKWNGEPESVYGD